MTDTQSNHVFEPTEGRRTGRTSLIYVALALLLLSPGIAPGDPGAQAAVPASPKMYANPVYGRDFPDPFLLAANGRFYAYATHSNGFGFQVMESSDLVNWTHKGTAFDVPWSKEHYWAPEVVAYQRRYYMTYSAKNPETHKHDIGIATADSPLGPFTHRAILVRGDDNKVGVIDATIFFDGRKKPYLIYSEEEPRRIVMRALSPDLLKAEDSITELVHPDRPQEHNVTEAPTFIRYRGKYHLFFSAGWYQSNKADVSYAVYHASSASLRGPYVKDAEPILQTLPGKVYGPGHQCILTLPSREWWMGYHAWDDQGEPRYGANPSGRTLRIDRMRWNGDKPVVDGPTVTPQPAPRLRRRRH